MKLPVLFKNKSPYDELLKTVARDGFTDEYIRQLEEKISQQKRPDVIAKGRSYLVNGLVMRGELTKAIAVFEQADEKDEFRKLDGILMQNMLHNVIFSLFICDKTAAADKLYDKYNAQVLSSPIDTMKRTLAIHEHINGRFENSVTVLAKLLGSDCRFVDLCLAKTLLRLDMYERAEEISRSFDAYSEKNELEAAAAKLKKKIFSGVAAASKVKMIKNKKHGK